MNDFNYDKLVDKIAQDRENKWNKGIINKILTIIFALGVLYGMYTHDFFFGFLMGGMFLVYYWITKGTW